MSLNFSQRMGLTPVRTAIQKDSMNDALRNKLWNAVTSSCWAGLVNENRVLLENHAELHNFVRLLWHDYFGEAFDTIGAWWGPVHTRIREHFFACPWYQVYDFLEFVHDNGPWLVKDYGGHYVDSDKTARKRNAFVSRCKDVLESELSACRFVDGKVVPITSEAEIASVEKAAALGDKFKPVSDHLRQAIDLFSDRQNPDYRNSIKESISAVEGLCNLLNAGKKASLGDALKTLEAKVPMHPALKGAFEKLYGYTSDAEGIRHALLDESNLTQDDAKFMLVACSAFVNYLIAKSASQAASAAP